jgi:putative RecB family exonuclease
MYSYSQLETYGNCPFKYRLQYIERIRSERKSIEAFMGTTVHAALEKLYRDLRMSRLPDVDELTRCYDELWHARYCDEVFVVRSEYDPDDYRETGLRCLRDYHRRYYPFDSGVPVWLEKKVNIPICDARGRTIQFAGILDRLDSLEEGRYEIHDYKTSSTLPTRSEIERDRQLSLYQLAVEEAFPDAQEVDLVWHYLVFDRELRLRRERSDLESIAAAAAAAVCEIEKAEDFPARESVLCGWCEYQEHCPKRKHLYMVAEMPERELGTDRGIQLVDQFAQWHALKCEAEEHMDELRAEILDFSSFHDVDNLQGSSHVLKIYRDRMPRLPPRESDERRELEKALRDADALDEVSAINVRKLSSLLKRDDLAEGLRGCLEGVIDWQEVFTLRLCGD